MGCRSRRTYLCPMVGQLPGVSIMTTELEHQLANLRPGDHVVLIASHDFYLVALSVLISILAAYAARDLSERIRDARGRAWLSWLVGGGTARGICIWSMHFTAMQAFSLPVPVQYDWPTVLLSLLVAILGSAAALFVVSRGIIG